MSKMKNVHSRGADGGVLRVVVRRTPEGVISESLIDGDTRDLVLGVVIEMMRDPKVYAFFKDLMRAYGSVWQDRELVRQIRAGKDVRPL